MNRRDGLKRDPRSGLCTRTGFLDGAPVCSVNLPAWFVNLYRGVQDVTPDAGRQISDGVALDFVSVTRRPLGCVGGSW